jgi:hypothetical protein
MHHGSRANLDDVKWNAWRWIGSQAYGESEFIDALLALTVTRYWPDVLSNAPGPGWVPTKMGDPSALDDADKAHRTQAWLGISNDANARMSGRYFFHMHERACDAAAKGEAMQID